MNFNLHMSRADMEFCKRLMTSCNEVLKSLSPKYIHSEAINWADLSCVSVEKFTAFYSETVIACGWRVRIEEASPDAYIFRKAVQERLTVKGFNNIEIETEW